MRGGGTRTLAAIRRAAISRAELKLRSYFQPIYMQRLHRAWFRQGQAAGTFGR